jgi:spore coat protein U-like protein
MAGADLALLRYALASSSKVTASRGAITNTDTVARTRDSSAQVLAAVGELSAGHYVGTGLFAGSIIVTVTY